MKQQRHSRITINCLIASAIAMGSVGISTADIGKVSAGGRPSYEVLGRASAAPSSSLGAEQVRSVAGQYNVSDIHGRSSNIPAKAGGKVWTGAADVSHLGRAGGSVAQVTHATSGSMTAALSK